MQPSDAPYELRQTPKSDTETARELEASVSIIIRGKLLRG